MPSVPDAVPLSPVASLRAYYEALNARQYAQTWGQLAPQFKQTHFCCESDGSFQFGRYRAWWEQVARVEVLDAHVQERQPAEVVVQATVRYVMRNGSDEVKRNLDSANTRRLSADYFRTCVALDDKRRAFCMFVDTKRHTVRPDGDARPNAVVFGNSPP